MEAGREIPKEIKESAELAERLKNAQRLFEDFIALAPEEKVLFLTDEDSYNTDRELIDILKKALEAKNVQFDEMVGHKDLPQDELYEKMKVYKVLWTTWDMEDTKIDFYEMVKHMQSVGGRMSFSPGVRAESLLDDGALAESKEDLDRRAAKVLDRVRDLQGMRVQSTYGTDLTMGFRQGERRWVAVNGDLQPGRWDNMPGGEVFTTPDEETVNGLLVLPVLQDEVSKQQGVDEYVRLTIRNGRIAAIDGGKSADKLRKYLEKASRTQSKESKDPTDPVRIAEVAFGINSKARPVVANPERTFMRKGNSTSEAEKRLGTMHLAFGTSEHGEEGSEGFHKDTDTHLDFVIPRNGLTVTGYSDRESFKTGKKGTKLIDEGRWDFY